MRDHATAEVSQPKVTIASMSYPERVLTILAESVDIVDGPIAVDSSGRTLWQQESGEQIDLVRGTAEHIDVWSVTGMSFLDLNASTTEVVAAQVSEIGEESDVVDILALDLNNPRLVVDHVDTVAGLQALWISGDGRRRLHSVQPAAARPISFEVDGDDDWNVTISDALGSPAALAADGRLLYRRPSTSTIEVVARDGTPGSSPLGTTQVLAFDMSPSDVLAFGSANFTGGEGALCLLPTAATETP